MVGTDNASEDSDLDDLLTEVRSEGNTDREQNRVTLLALICAYFLYACEYAPRFCLAVGCIAIIVPSYFLVMLTLNPTEHFGEINNDYTDIQSKYDLKVNKIDHWCLQGDDVSCRCEDPLQPQARAEFRKWTRAHNSNKELVAKWVREKENPDVAFVGASVVEEMDGRWFGNAKDSDLQELEKLFGKSFKKTQGAKLDAVALGIAGDTSPSILWRLMNGEMPSGFNPKIWWLEIGMNDIGRTQCSEEVVLLGVLRIVEEILNIKEDAHIVINSLLPMAELRGDFKPSKLDFKDSFFKSTIAATSSDGGRRRLRDQTARRTGWLSSLFGGEDEKRDKSVRMSAGKTKQKRYTPIAHKERKLPIWTSIHAINVVLSKFASKQDRVTFFDSTNIFAQQEEGDIWILNATLISPRGHPSVAGYKKWESAVIQKARKLLKDGSI